MRECSCGVNYCLINVDSYLAQRVVPTFPVALKLAVAISPLPGFFTGRLGVEHQFWKRLPLYGGQREVFCNWYLRGTEELRARRVVLPINVTLPAQIKSCQCCEALEDT